MMVRKHPAVHRKQLQNYTRSLKLLYAVGPRSVRVSVLALFIKMVYKSL